MSVAFRGSSAQRDRTSSDVVGISSGDVLTVAGQPPGHVAGLVLGQVPARCLFAAMVLAAERGAVAFAGAAALVERRRVVDVTESRGAAATRSGAGPLPGLDQVSQGGGPGVTGGLPGVGA